MDPCLVSRPMHESLWAFRRLPSVSAGFPVGGNQRERRAQARFSTTGIPAWGTSGAPIIPKNALIMAMAVADPKPRRGGKPNRGKSNRSSASIAVTSTELSECRFIIKTFGIDSAEVTFVMNSWCLAYDWSVSQVLS